MKFYIKGKTWKVIKRYPSFYLCINDYGIRECFSRFELTK